MTQQHQYSPQDIFGFGQRAEAEGRFAYALQIYTHLAQHYAHDQIGIAAHQGMTRIHGMTRREQLGSPQLNQEPTSSLSQLRAEQLAGGVPIAPTNDIGSNQTTPVMNGVGQTYTPHQPEQTLVNQNQQENVLPASQSGTLAPSLKSISEVGEVKSSRGTALTEPGIHKKQSNDDYLDDEDDMYTFRDLDVDELEDTRLQFRAGWLAMHLANIIGWVVLVGGIALFVVQLFDLGGPTIGPVLLTGIWVYLPSAGLFLSGILLVLASQIARASFESANAARQMLIIERGRAGL